MEQKLLEKSNFCVGGEILNFYLHEVTFFPGFSDAQSKFLILITNSKNNHVAECVFSTDKENNCNLECIEILDATYSKKAIGTKIIKKVEEVAKKQKCEKMTGLYLPFGDLANNTFKFYKKNSYKIKTADNGISQILYKEL